MFKIIFYFTILFCSQQLLAQNKYATDDGFDLQCVTKLGKPATFRTGKKGWKHYIESNYRWRKEMDKYYPAKKGLRIYDTIRISFVVKPDGFVKDVEIMYGKIPVFSNEAARVIASSPQWKAGRHNERKVSFRFVQQMIVLLEK